MQKHLIFTSGRSGSNYLSNTLNLSPECLNYGEVLGEWTLPYKMLGKFFLANGKVDKYLDIIYSNRCYYELAQLYSAYAHVKGGRLVNYKKYSKIKSIGIKDFFVTMEWQQCFDYFLKDLSIKVIYLHRDNILQRYVSGLFLKSSGLATSYQKLDTGKVTIDIDDLLSQLKIFDEECTREKEFISKLTKHDVLDIEYQAYFQSPQSTQDWNGAIFDFLGIEPVKEMSKQTKILSNSLKDVVTNYVELLDAIRGSQYEKLLY
ncbi:MAG: hypothetical protein HOO87_09385 [Methyloglobulus sp.]|nr:hypothetical protein [Methyloglobulus sp.]